MSSGIPRQRCLCYAGVTRFGPPGNRDGGPNVQAGVDDEERQAVRAEGLNPDDPAVAAAIDMVRWESDGRDAGLSPQQSRLGAVRRA
jgi:hypothetical protein